MWTRAELKMRAKQAFRRNYWSSVLVALVMTAVTGIASSSSSNNDDAESIISDIESIESLAAVFAILATVMIVMVVALVIKIIVGNALIVGGSRFFVMNQMDKPRAGELAFAFKSGSLGNVILVMFLRDLFIGLWTLLFIIPGIIKSYEYLMVPYILAENPQMNQREVFAISKQMMSGQKLNAFVLDLSFVGWKLMEVFTCGIAGIFYVEPYYQATIAELYTANRAIAYQKGYIK